MKRWGPWAIVAGVLVPFAVLVVLGLRYTRGEDLVPRAPMIPVRVEPPPPPTPPATRDAAPPAPAQTPRAAPPEKREEPLPAPLRAVASEARRCLADASPQHALEIEVRFTPTRDGGYEAVSSSAQDPMLAACLEDVFAELHFDPSQSAAFTPVRHVFRFDPKAR